MEKKKTEPVIDISKHTFVPKHKLLTDEETQKVLKTYNISKKQLPYILAKDPAIKEMKVKLGDVIEITRNSETNGEIKFYRVVING